MKRLLLMVCVALLFIVLTGCGGGGGGSELPQNYIGVFKSIHTSNDKMVTLTITADDGVSYEGTLDSIPLKGGWGVYQSDSLGLVAYQLDKGADTNFINFMLSIGGAGVSGTALRQ